MIAGTQRKCSLSITELPCEDDTCQVVDGLVRRHLGAVGLVGQEPVLTSSLIFSSAVPTADGETCLWSPTTSTFWPRSKAGSAQMSDCDASSMTTRSNRPNLGRYGLGYAPLRQHPTGHCLVRPHHRVARRLAVTNCTHAGSSAHRLDGVQVGLQRLTHRVRRVVEHAQPGLLGNELLIRAGQRVVSVLRSSNSSRSLW
jgi:hypothetical protein